MPAAAAAPAASGALAPRRSARVTSLARFRYREEEEEEEEEEEDKKAIKQEIKEESDVSLSGLSFGSDIEDAVVEKSGVKAKAKGKAAPKRKRAVTVTGSATRKKRAGAVKAEEAGEAEEAKAPSGWEEVYGLVKAMRLGDGPAAHAAVDTMGCERLAQAGASARDRRFHTLVALMLSSQTKDTVNAVAMARLQAELPACRPGAPAGLNLDNLLAVNPALLNQLIWQVGFHNNKTRYLKQAAEILRDQWAGDIPDTAEGLMALPGVGPKMAYLCLAAEHGWNRVEGIGVDVHVHRITNLWGWQTPRTTTPEATRLALQRWLPRDRWKEINWLLVGFGQTVCLPQGAKCGECTLGLRGLCRAADRKKVAQARKAKGLP